MASRDHRVTTLEALEALYDKPYGPSVIKEIDHINPHYRKFIEAAPFFALATSGPEGLDCSPRGDAPGFVRVADEKMLLIPDRRGNNRIDSLRNILADPRVALLFLIPGVGETIRSKLWDPALHVDRKSLPSAGTILAEISGGKIGGPEHDRGQPQRIKETLY